MTKRPPRWREDGAAQRAAPSISGDVEERAASLGITEERVLQECARIAFADIRKIVGWDEDGIMKAVKPAANLADDEAAAIAEIVAAAKDSKIYRVKLHDKKAVLIALLRYLGMLAPPSGPNDNETDDGDDPREFLKRELARIAARGGQG